MAFTTTEIQELHVDGMEHVIELSSKDMQDHEMTLLGNRITTKQKYEDMLSFTGFGLPEQIEEDEPIRMDKVYKAFTAQFEPKIRQKAWSIHELAKLTDQYGVLNRNTKRAMKSLANGRTYNAAEVYNSAFTTNGPDGVPLCSHSHPKLDGTLQSNRGDGVSAELTLGYTNLSTAISILRGMEDYRGTPLMYSGSFDLIVSESKEDLAHRLKGSRQMPGSANNDINEAGSRINKVISMPWIGWGDSTMKDMWFLRASDPDEHFLFSLHQFPVTPRASYDIKYLSFVDVVFESYVMGWFHHFGIYGSNPA